MPCDAAASAPMKVAYTIVSIDDSRAGTRQAIRERMAFLPEATGIECVDGRNVARLDECLRGYQASAQLQDGELGVWFSQINCWRHLARSNLDALLVVEDDAEIDAGIEFAMSRFMERLPEGWDFFALHVPQDQKQDYFYERSFGADGTWHLVSERRHTLESSPHHFGDPILAIAYQGYSSVATLYSRSGAEKLLALVGPAIRDPVDCFLFTQHYRGCLRGYAPKPYIRDLVVHREHGTIARATGMRRRALHA